MGLALGVEVCFPHFVHVEIVTCALLPVEVAYAGSHCGVHSGCFDHSLRLDGSISLRNLRHLHEEATLLHLSLIHI